MRREVDCYQITPGLVLTTLNSSQTFVLLLLRGTVSCPASDAGVSVHRSENVQIDNPPVSTNKGTYYEHYITPFYSNKP